MEEKLDVTKFWEEEERDEERRLREKVRTERKVLKGLREELNELWWDRGRLIADALFAGEFLPRQLWGSILILCW